MNVKTIIITFHSFRLQPFEIPKFRGYLAAKYKNYTLIHNHLNNGKLRYAYPVIQFKVIDTHPTIVGIGDGIDILKTVFLDISSIDIEGMRHNIHEKSVKLDFIEFGQTHTPYSYQFLLPWMGLNQNNHKIYKSLKRSEKHPFLENILKGNLKSFSKGCNYFIPDFDKLALQAELYPVYRNFKNRKMFCFTGAFKVNFLIPDYLGLGKQTARGFGTVVRVHNETSE